MSEVFPKAAEKKPSLFGKITLSEKMALHHTLLAHRTGNGTVSAPSHTPGIQFLYTQRKAAMHVVYTDSSVAAASLLEHAVYPPYDGREAIQYSAFS